MAYESLLAASLALLTAANQDPIWAHRKNGEDTDADFDFAAWRQKHWDFAQIAVPIWVAAVKAQYGEASTKYAAVGYCFGAPYVCDLLAAEDVTAGAFAHPSFLKESHFYQIKSIYHISSLLR